VPELVAELRRRATRARSLEVRIATLRQTPNELRSIVDQAEAAVRERLGNLRAALADGTDLRQIFLRLFPNGVKFHPTRAGARQGWRIEGAAAIGRVAVNENDPWFNMRGDPSPDPEATRSHVGPEAGPRKIGDISPEGNPPSPDQEGEFNMRCDPNGI
jgi:hypothetical protein